MIQESLDKLFALPEDQFNAKVLKKLVYKVIDNNNGKKDVSATCPLPLPPF